MSVAQIPPGSTPVSGTVTVVQPTGTNLHAVLDSGTTTVTQGTGTNLHTVVDSGTITTVSAVTALTNALPAGSNVIGKTSIDQATPGTTNRTQLGTVTFASDNGTPVATGATTDVVAAPSSGHHLEIYYLHASNSGSTATLVGFKEASGTLLFNTYLPQNGVVSKNLEGSWHLTTATKLQMVTSAAGSVYWTVGTRTEVD